MPVPAMSVRAQTPAKDLVDRRDRSGGKTGVEETESAIILSTKLDRR
jgi:hypothetical protein